MYLTIYLTNKIKTVFLLTTVFLMLSTVQSSAQQQTTQNSNTANKQTGDNTKNTDIEITAKVTARELKFDVVPNPRVEFTGKQERQTVWEADRQNLPRPVEPGVTYRNIGIQLRISSRFADIERIVAEALGEIPISDSAPNNTNQSSTPNSVISSPSAPVNQNKKP